MMKVLKRFFEALFALMIVAMGIVFIVWPFGFVRESLKIDKWEKTECTIESFWFDQPKNTNYRLRVRFYYRYDGKNYESENVRLTDITFMDRGDAGPLVSELTPGADHTCYVNPKNPEEAVLFKPMKFEVFIHWFGLFMGGALAFVGGIIFLRVLVDKNVDDTAPAVRT